MSCSRIIHVPTIFLHHKLYNITIVEKKNCKIICVPTLYIFFSTLLYPNPKTLFFFLSLFTHPLIHFVLIFLFSFSFTFLHTKLPPPPSPTHTHTHTQVWALSLSLSLSTPYVPFIKNSTEFKRFFLRLDM